MLLECSKTLERKEKGKERLLMSLWSSPLVQLLKTNSFLMIYPLLLSPLASVCPIPKTINVIRSWL